MSFGAVEVSAKDFVEDAVVNYKSLGTLDDFEIATGYIQRFLKQYAVIYQSTTKWLFATALKDDTYGFLDFKEGVKNTGKHKELLIREDEFQRYEQQNYRYNKMKIPNIMEQIDIHYNLYCNPDAAQIIQFYHGYLKMLKVGQSLAPSDQDTFPQSLRSAIQSVSHLLGDDRPIEDLGKYIDDLDNIQSERSKTMINFLQNSGHISSWKSGDALKQALVNFDYQVELYCTAQNRKYGRGYDSLVNLIHGIGSIGGKGEEPPMEPIWLFYSASRKAFWPVEVDSKYFKTMKSVELIRGVGSLGTKTGLQKFLRKSRLKRNWKLFAQLTFIINPFIDESILILAAQKRSKDLRSLKFGADVLMKPSFVGQAVTDVCRSGTIDDVYAQGMIILATEVNLAIEPPPSLEGEDEAHQMERRFDEHMQKKLRETESFEAFDVPEHQDSGLLKDLRWLSTDSDPNPKNDKASVLPILLLGAMIFLFVR